MNKWAWGAALALPLALLWRRSNVENRFPPGYVPIYFRPCEFQGWAWAVSPGLLAALDSFRDAWGGPVMISPARGAVGRRLGPDSLSCHNVDRWGVVLAVDVMPLIQGGDGPPRGCTRDELHIAYQKARGIFHGIGAYPLWRPYPGLHLDVRPSRSAVDPALWSCNRAGDYVALDDAWAAV